MLLTIAPATIAYTHKYVQDVLDAIRAVRAAVDLDYVRFEGQAGGGYLYRLHARDGRLWRQTITVLPADEQHTFSFSDAWLLSEFTLQRDVRDSLVRLARQFNITSFEARFDYV